MADALKTIKLPVRELTDFLCRSGSLDLRAGINRMVEGTRMHNILQSRGGAGYVREVTLGWVFEVDGLLFELSGRADGIIDEEDGYTVDEIKTTTLPLRYVNEEDYPAYAAQVECYACIFAKLHRLDFVRTRLTFCNIETEDCVYFYHDHAATELEERVISLLREYKKWILMRARFDSELRESANLLKFPFPDFREGQSDMILAAHRAFRRRERLYVQAPTGIGKTMSAIYPAFKALGGGVGRRIFYLTAKTPLRAAAQNAVDLLRKKGLHARSIILTAKEKCCLCKSAVRDCSSLACEYSDGHYTRINDALWAMLNGYERFTPELIEKCAREYKVCPFELSLDLSLWCEIIICDYNYLFDPRVALKRFFGSFDDPSTCTPDENLILVDEAHNLADRAREMYSAELCLNPFLEFLRKIPESDLILYKPLRELCRQFLRLKRRAAADAFEGGGGFLRSDEPFAAFGEAVERFSSAALEWLKINGGALTSEGQGDGLLPSPDRLADLRMDALRYSFTLGLFDKSYVNYTEVIGDDIRVKLLCRDPSGAISRRLSRGRAAMLFSATLTPLDYFADLLGGGKERVLLELDSPFPRENLFVAAMDKVSTRYLDRDRTIEAAAEVLRAVVCSKPGNYLAYFPSYRLMREVAAAFHSRTPEVRCIVQRPDMTESDRDAFIRQFDQKGRTMLGFAVLGGIFSEGIDLVGERLIGSVIIGVGLAQLNTESNLIAEYYNETREQGYEYAYVYPGMNKVLQAAGRVIRTDTDRGVIILVDDRFATPTYTGLFPAHWKEMRLIGDNYSLRRALERFWAQE